MLKITKAAVSALLVAGASSGAFADARFDVNMYRGNPAPEAIYAAQSRPEAVARQFDNARSAYAAAAGIESAHTVNSNANAVIEYGQYRGVDPDADVRLQLRRAAVPN